MDSNPTHPAPSTLGANGAGSSVRCWCWWAAWPRPHPLIRPMRPSFKTRTDAGCDLCRGNAKQTKKRNEKRRKKCENYWNWSNISKIKTHLACDESIVECLGCSEFELKLIVVLGQWTLCAWFASLNPWTGFNPLSQTPLASRFSFTLCSWVDWCFPMILKIDLSVCCYHWIAW